MDAVSMDELLNNPDPVQAQIDDLILALIKQRKKSGITQTDLSAASGIPQATISRVESFYGTPTLQVVLRLANAMGMQLKLSKLPDVDSGLPKG